MKTILRITYYLPILCFLFLNINDENATDNHFIKKNEERLPAIAKSNTILHQVRIGIENKSRRRLASSLSDERQL